jgi:hypothetical protein
LSLTSADITNALGFTPATSGGYNPAAVAIIGGTINNTAIGGSAPVAGSFTNLSSTVFTSTGVTTTLSAINASIEIGSTTSSNLPYIDFHSSGYNISYDSRISASGGTVTVGNGTLTLYCAGVTIPGTLTVGGTVSGSGFGPLLSTYAPLLSPNFTGTPIAPTAAPGTNTTQILIEPDIGKQLQLEFMAKGGSTSSLSGRFNAIRRANANLAVCLTSILTGFPELVYPARLFFKVII